MNIASPDNQCIVDAANVLSANSIDYEHCTNLAGIALEQNNKGFIEAISLDNIIDDDINFIKIDAQGCDLKVLQGSRSIINKCRPIIMIEFEKKLAKIHKEKLDDYISYINRIDYKYKVVSKNKDETIDFICFPK